MLLSRGPRFRLHSETIRDIALVTSGLLDRRFGGPSVFPVQPVGVVESAFGDARWPTSSGTDRYRRSIYTHRKRGAPFAAFAAFDGPPHHSCTVKRLRSNTPLQALARLNDSVVVESAQALALRIVSEGSSDDESKLNLAFQLCLTRDPRPDERTALALYLQDQRQRFQTDDVAASQVAGETDPKSGDSRRNADLAAWTLVARVLLNLDETMTKE